MPGDAQQKLSAWDAAGESEAEVSATGIRNVVRGHADSPSTQARLRGVGERLVCDSRAQAMPLPFDLDVARLSAPHALLLERYRPMQTLARAPGVVHLLVHDQWAERATSLVLIDLRAFGGAEATRRAEEEARALVELRHPHLVAVGMPIACEPLGVLCQEVAPGFEFEAGQRQKAQPVPVCPPRSLEEAVRFARDAAAGLDAAHAAGVFHLALTPRCLRVRPLSRRVEVQGFGLETTLSRLRAERAHTHGQRLDPSPSAGPPIPELDYLAPECLEWRGQAKAASDTATALRRCDVYGVAAVLHELLTGVPPLGPSATLHAQRVRLTQRSATPGPLQASPPHLSHGLGLPHKRVPRRLWDVLERALSAEPDTRHTSCGALAEDLQAFLDTRPTAQERTQPLQRARLWWRRSRAERWLLARVCLLITLCSIAIVGFAQAHKSYASLQQKQAQLQAYRTRHGAHVEAREGLHPASQTGTQPGNSSP